MAPASGLPPAKAGSKHKQDSIGLVASCAAGSSTGARSQWACQRVLAPNFAWGEVGTTGRCSGGIASPKAIYCMQMLWHCEQRWRVSFACL